MIITPEKGLGLACVFPIKANEFIIEYCGEFFHETDEEYKKRERKYKQTNNTYLFELENGFIYLGSF